jgi:hypothetical protein
MHEEVAPGKSHHGGLIVWIILLLPVLYVLSAGPVWRWFSRVPPSDPENRFRVIVEQLYAPVFWLHHKTVLRGPIGEYRDLWVRD